MTHDTKHPGRAALAAAALAALLLAGCTSGHVGESWQCPLAEGGTCDSVAAADPAVPDPDAARNAVLAEPLWRVRAGGPEAPPAREPAPDAIRGPGQAQEAPCETGCAGFDPLAWLKGLFAGESGDAAARPGGARPAATGREVPAGTATALPDAAGEAERRSAEPATAALPAEPGSRNGEPARDGPHAGDPPAGDLRTDEVVARIWIAPFVDAGGVYREASHVRVVLEPAGWRLGR